MSCDEILQDPFFSLMPGFSSCDELDASFSNAGLPSPPCAGCTCAPPAPVSCPKLISPCNPEQETCDMLNCDEALQQGMPGVSTCEDIEAMMGQVFPNMCDGCTCAGGGSGYGHSYG